MYRQSTNYEQLLLLIAYCNLLLIEALLKMRHLDGLECPNCEKYPSEYSRVRTLFGTKTSRTFQGHSWAQFQFFKYSMTSKKCY